MTPHAALSIALAGIALASPVAAQLAPDGAQAVFAEAMQAYRAREYRAAAARFDSAARLRPHNPRWAFNAAVAAARADEGARAVRWLRRVASLGAAYPLESEAFDPLREQSGFRAVRSRFDSLARPVASGGVAFTVPQRDLLPESIAYDPRHDIFYLGSLYRRTILRVERDGSTIPFVDEGEHGIWSVLGIKVDTARGVLWANSCNLGDELPTAVRDPANVGRTGVFRFGLPDGRLVGKHLSPSANDSVCFNDLTLAGNGDVYVSAGTNGVFRISEVTGTLEPFFDGPGVQVNGIALSPDEEVLYLADTRRGVIRLTLETKQAALVELPPNVTLNGVDGLYAHGASLVAVQNGHTPQRVIQAFLDPSGRRVTRLRVIDANHPRYAGPTTGVIVRDVLFYVATAQLTEAFGDDGRLGDDLQPNVVLRAPLAPARPTQAFRIDANHSTVGFAVPILGGLSEVEGKFTDFAGTIDYDPQALTRSAVHVEIDAASVNTGKQDRDDHLRTADFFDVANHPRIHFSTNRVEANGDGHVLIGELTIRGTTLPVVIPFRRTHEAPVMEVLGQEAIAFEGVLEVDREDYGVKATARWNRPVNAAGELAMSDRVQIRLKVIAVRAEGGSGTTP